MRAKIISKILSVKQAFRRLRQYIRWMRSGINCWPAASCDRLRNSAYPIALLIAFGSSYHSRPNGSASEIRCTPRWSLLAAIYAWRVGKVFAKLGGAKRIWIRRRTLAPLDSSSLPDPQSRKSTSGENGYETTKHNKSSCRCARESATCNHGQHLVSPQNEN